MPWGSLSRARARGGGSRLNMVAKENGVVCPSAWAPEAPDRGSNRVIEFRPNMVVQDTHAYARVRLPTGRVLPAPPGGVRRASKSKRSEGSSHPRHRRSVAYIRPALDAKAASAVGSITSHRTSPCDVLTSALDVLFRLHLCIICFCMHISLQRGSVGCSWFVQSAPQSQPPTGRVPSHLLKRTPPRCEKK